MESFGIALGPVLPIAPVLRACRRRPIHSDPQCKRCEHARDISEAEDFYEEENKTLGTDIGTNEQEILGTTEVEEQLKKKAGNDTAKLETIKNGFRLCTQDYIKQELGIESVKRDYIVNLSERMRIASSQAVLARFHFSMSNV